MIEDEAAIITGASSAIGKAVARLPARLAIASERNGLHAVSNDVDGGQGSMAIRAKVSSRGQPPASARQAVAPRQHDRRIYRWIEENFSPQAPDWVRH